MVILIHHPGGTPIAELELVSHPQIPGVHLFFNTLDHRSLHVHADWELVWVLEEPLAVTCNGDTCTVPPGELVLFHPGHPHAFHKVHASCTFLCLQMDPSAFPACQGLYVQDPLVSPHLTQEELDWLQQTLLALLRSYLQAPPLYQLDCLGHIHLILHLLLNRLPIRPASRQEEAEGQRRNGRLMRLLAFAEENYTHKIRLADFPRQERRSRSYISHFAREMLGQSFQDYVASLRFHHACHLISHTQKGMLEVCMEAGFSDYRYFSRMFQHHFSMTPQAYRQQAQPPHLPTSHAAGPGSSERFYSPEGSLQLLDQLEQQYRDKKASLV